MTNPAYVQWITMVKDGTEKPVHPGNVVNHERFGWKRKDPVVTTEPATGLSLPELAETLIETEAATTETEASVSSETADASGFEVLTSKGNKPRKSRKG